MDFGLSDDQQLFQQALRGWLAENVSIESVRTLIHSDKPRDSTIVTGLAKQGVCGMLIPERYGGSGLGLLDATVAAEELGRALVPYSLHSAATMAPLALSLAGSASQRDAWLARAAAGEALLTYVNAAPAIEDGKLCGRVRMAADADRADALVVACKTEHGARLVLLPGDAPGLSTETLLTIDATRRVSTVTFDEVVIDETMGLSDCDHGSAERIVDAGRIVLAADALGACERALELAVEYAQTRRQFGRVIGSFQAVKHMCAEAVAEIEPLRSLAWYAAFAWDQGYDDAARAARLLKAHAAEVATRVLSTCVQVYGGMGFTYECDMQLWFKRVGYDRQVLGGPAAMRAEAARLRLSHADTLN